MVRTPAKCTHYNDLLTAFWASHDPTQRDRRGPDVGAQYHSAIFCHNEAQRKAARKSKKNSSRKKPMAKLPLE
ncbi:TPA: peptide-methionine (S)-S-oxide reductase [Candidatus Woesearchaeota archaeon]|nr:peptide-methionine (S)-S-oxide reductase [Candidatus Woesearchaeota archaeon]